MVGMFLNNHTTLSYTTLTYVGGDAYRYFREDVIIADAKPTERAHRVISGAIRVGLEIKTKTRLSPLIELQYSIGRDSDNNPGLRQTMIGTKENIGHLHYKALGFSAGVEF
jgi:hypothetical protein